MLSTFTVNKTPLLNPFRTPWLEPRSPQGTVMSQYCIPDYQPQHYGFFCRVESKIERKSKLAPRFRLGSVNYVDALEGKYVPIVK